MAINRICPRCGKVVPSGQRCPCAATRYRDYNRFRRDSRIRYFRQSAEWKATREQIIARDEGLDQWLLHTTGEIVPGCSVHHIRPLAEYWEGRLDRGNLITLSERSHERIEYQYKHGRKEELQAQLLAIVAEQETSTHREQSGKG